MCRTRTTSRAGRSPYHSEPSIEKQKPNTPGGRCNSNSSVMPGDRRRRRRASNVQRSTRVSSEDRAPGPLVSDRTPSHPGGAPGLLLTPRTFPGDVPKSPRQTSANSGLDRRESPQHAHFQVWASAVGRRIKSGVSQTAAYSGLGREGPARMGLLTKSFSGLIRSSGRLIRTRREVVRRPGKSIQGGR